MNKYDISVCIPTYNRKNILRNTLLSLDRQSCPKEKYEVVLVHDGSTDGISIELERTRREFSYDLRCIRMEKNQGIACARNVTVENAEGEIIPFLDDESIADENLLYEHKKTHSGHRAEKIAVMEKKWEKGRPL